MILPPLVFPGQGDRQRVIGTDRERGMDRGTEKTREGREIERHRNKYIERY